jgi:uncharacterized protein YdeI (YjbR/CyaY-like superfamily)
MTPKKSIKKDKNDFPVMEFPTQQQWHLWLSKNHTALEGVWLKFHKKHSGLKSINYVEAVEEALCFGWIDGHVKPFDANSWIQKFTPRRAKSIWSKRNTERVMQLIEEGRMKPAGLKEIEAAKADGRWQKAYDSPGNMTVPDDFLKRLSKNKKAKQFFESLNKTNKYAINWRLQTAKKPETREKRMKAILEMLAKGEKFH